MEIYRDIYTDIYMYTPTYIISTQSFGSTISFQTKLREEPRSWPAALGRRRQED